MAGVELILLLVGCIFMVGSFFITEKLSPSELNKLAEISEDELKNIVNRQVENAGVKIEEAIDERLEASMDRVDRALEKETNEKIMAINEFSDTIVENMNKTHSEIMFLYSMLNDKHVELTGMVSDLQRLAADVRNMQERIPTSGAVPAAQPVPLVTPQPVVPVVRASAVIQNAAEVPKAEEKEQPKRTAEEELEHEGQVSEQEEEENHNKRILALHKEGCNVVDIAKKLGLGIGEVRLVIGLYKGESDS